ncbi:hypothetical protein F4778DRAFT_538111 [Xylariomycetidae sp. FL2044]|nr:hypothetical protein F4778DRAFT_538111 [Xylariomycetidae sp. FL2044]
MTPTATRARSNREESLYSSSALDSVCIGSALAPSSSTSSSSTMKPLRLPFSSTSSKSSSMSLWSESSSLSTSSRSAIVDSWTVSGMWTRLKAGVDRIPAPGYASNSGPKTVADMPEAYDGLSTTCFSLASSTFSKRTLRLSSLGCSSTGRHISLYMARKLVQGRLRFLITEATSVLVPDSSVRISRLLASTSSMRLSSEATWPSRSSIVALWSPLAQVPGFERGRPPEIMENWAKGNAPPEEENVVKTGPGGG